MRFRRKIDKNITVSSIRTIFLNSGSCNQAVIEEIKKAPDHVLNQTIVTLEGQNQLVVSAAITEKEARSTNTIFKIAMITSILGGIVTWFLTAVIPAKAGIH